MSESAREQIKRVDAFWQTFVSKQDKKDKQRGVHWLARAKSK